MHIQYTTMRNLHHFRALNYALSDAVYLQGILMPRYFGSLHVSNNNISVT